MYVCTPEEGIGSHRNTVKEACVPPCGYWELNSGFLEEQPVLFSTKPPLQPRVCF